MRFISTLAAVALITGCSGSSSGNEDPKTTALSLQYDICGTKMVGSDVAKMIDGNLVVVGEYSEQGRTGAQMAVGMAETMALNGIDFSDPSPVYKFSHENGEYSVKNGDAGWTVRLYWAKDFEAHKAGDKLTDDVLAVSSYATNVRFDLTSGKVKSDAGPLASLVDGDIDYDASNPLDIHVKAKLRADVISLELESVGIYKGLTPRDSDTFTWHMTTLRSTIGEIANQAKTGAGYGLSFANSKYTSPFFGVEEDFGAAKVLVVKDSAGKFQLEGPYDATLTTGGNMFFQRGKVSTSSANQTEYFCDGARTRRVGVATHSLDLTGGTFVLDADGSQIPYGLEEF